MSADGGLAAAAERALREPSEVVSVDAVRLRAPIPTPPSVRQCQAPKPVFLGTGTQNPPWTPQIMPLQVLRIGQLALTTAPGEFTVVAGQRVVDAVAAELGGTVRHHVLAGYANAYAGYVTTPEEYDAQHYEGAATHFGRYTQPAYAQELAALADALATIGRAEQVGRRAARALVALREWFDALLDRWGWGWRRGRRPWRCS